MTDEVPSYCCVGLMFDVKKMTLESVNDPVFSLSNIFDAVLVVL